MRLDLFAWPVGVWASGFNADSDARLYEGLMDLWREVRTGPEVWDRKPHDIFTDKADLCADLKELVTACAREFMAGKGEVASVTGRVVVREKGQEILTHTDQGFSHIHGVYFPLGAELAPEAVNHLSGPVYQFGKNGLGLSNNANFVTNNGGQAPRMPWEAPRTFWIAPHRGLLVLHDARMVHQQRPSNFDGLFMNVSLNIQVRATHG